MRKKIFRIVPSKSIHYLRCPHFLFVSNLVNVYIEHPPIIGIQRAMKFKKTVIARISDSLHKKPVFINNPVDMLDKDGLFLMRSNIEFPIYSVSDLDIIIPILQPDFLHSEKIDNRLNVSVCTIKNVMQPRFDQLFQAYLYKLAIYNKLLDVTYKPPIVHATVIHWKDESLLKKYEETEYTEEDISFLRAGLEKLDRDISDKAALK